MSQLKHKGMKKCLQGLTASEWQSQTMNPGSLAPEPTSLIRCSTAWLENEKGKRDFALKRKQSHNSVMYPYVCHPSVPQSSELFLLTSALLPLSWVAGLRLTLVILLGK